MTDCVTCTCLVTELIRACVFCEKTTWQKSMQRNVRQNSFFIIEWFLVCRKKCVSIATKQM